MSAPNGHYVPVGGREGMAAAAILLPWSIALGRGAADWDAVDRANAAWQSQLLPDAAQARTLVDEYGRRLADEVSFVAPDPEGEITDLPGGRWRRTGGPVSPYLYVRAFLDFGDASDVVREIGLFAGGLAIEGAPPGLRWWGPADLAEPGHLMQLVRLAQPRTYDSGDRPHFHFVMPF